MSNVFQPATPGYEKTRQAWRDIWEGTEFDRELHTLSYPRSQEILNYYVPYLPKSLPVLEAGCGTGHVVYYLRQQGYNVIGLDYAPEALHPTLNRFPTLPLHMGDVHTLPYPRNYFGSYLSFGVVEHFEHGPAPALQEAFRVLAPQGVLVLTVPHPQFVDSLYHLKERIFPSSQKRAEYYERTYHYQELSEIVRRVGFEIELVKPVAHSYTFYGLNALFRKSNAYYESTPLGEWIGALARGVLPWSTGFHSLIIGRKPA